MCFPYLTLSKENMMFWDFIFKISELKIYKIQDENYIHNYSHQI